MNDNILNICGVDCYEKNGVVYLRLETVARGLGFTQEKDKTEYIRWDRIERYLESFGFPHKWGKDDFIPENIFYRLAMKAKNETAEKFQAIVADEVIPSIRRKGYYNIQENYPVPVLVDYHAANAAASLMNVQKDNMVRCGCCGAEISAMMVSVMKSCGVPISVAFAQTVKDPQLSLFDALDSAAAGMA